MYRAELAAGGRDARPAPLPNVLTDLYTRLRSVCQTNPNAAVVSPDELRWMLLSQSFKVDETTVKSFSFMPDKLTNVELKTSFTVF